MKPEKCIHPAVAEYFNYPINSEEVVPPQFEYLAPLNAEVFADHKAIALMHALGFPDDEVMAVAKAQDILRERNSHDLVQVLNSDTETANESINHFREKANLASQINKAMDFNHFSGRLGNRRDLTSLSETAKIFIQNNIVDPAAINAFCEKRARGTIEFYVKAVTRSVPKSDPNYQAFHKFERDGLPHLWDDLHNNTYPQNTFSTNKLLPPTFKHASLPPPLEITNWRLKNGNAGQNDPAPPTPTPRAYFP